MTRGFSTELQVGVFTAAALGMLAFGYSFTYDGVQGGADSYTLFLRVPTADGIWEGTPVRLAGVDIGAVQTIGVDGNQAGLQLTILGPYDLPSDSVGELRSSGMLGERYIAVDPGRAESMLRDGARLDFGQAPGDFDAITEIEVARTVVDEEPHLAGLVDRRCDVVDPVSIEITADNLYRRIDGP